MPSTLLRKHALPSASFKYLGDQNKQAKYGILQVRANMVAVNTIVFAALALLPTTAFAGTLDLYSRGFITNDDAIPCNNTYTKVANPPTTRTCDAQGSVLNPAQISQSKRLGSEIACITKAKTTTGVVSYSWTAKGGVCKLYSKRVIDMKFRRSQQTGTAFSNVKCYEPACLCDTETHPTLCGDMCANTEADKYNCGACGNACTFVACVDSMCPECIAGQTCPSTPQCCELESLDP